MCRLRFRLLQTSFSRSRVSSRAWLVGWFDVKMSQSNEGQTVPRLEFKNQLVFSQLTRLPSGNSSQPVIFKKARAEKVLNSFLKPWAVARPVELRPTSGSRSPCRVSTSSGSFQSCERIFNNNRSFILDGASHPTATMSIVFLFFL